MFLVWTFTVMVPLLRGRTYKQTNCTLLAVTQVSPLCWENDFFANIPFSEQNLVSYKMLEGKIAQIFRALVKPVLAEMWILLLAAFNSTCVKVTQGIWLIMSDFHSVTKSRKN